MKTSTFYLLALILFLPISLIAQQSKNQTPAWVKMMDDPNANYYEAVKSFDAFWKGKEMPMEEEELMNEDMSRHEKREHRRAERRLRNMTPAERQQYDYLAYQSKRFINWRREIKPFVQENGRILSQEERNKIWEQQQQEAENRKH